MPRCVCCFLAKKVRTSSRLDWHTHEIVLLEPTTGVSDTLFMRRKGGGPEAEDAAEEGEGATAITAPDDDRGEATVAARCMRAALRLSASGVRITTGAAGSAAAEATCDEAAACDRVDGSTIAGTRGGVPGALAEVECGAAEW